jgi:RHS repeat-associated protein
VGGEVLAVYDFNGVTKTFTFVRRYAWFAGKMVGKREDRLGTVQTGSRYYPYGEEWPATAQDDVKFATYWRDGSTNLDYAMNRYYQSSLGRFLSPDPYRGSASVARSGSWNRYAYVEGDPANGNDPSGLCRVIGTHFVCDVVEMADNIRPVTGLIGIDRPPTYEEVDIGETRYAGLSFYYGERRREAGFAESVANGLMAAVQAGVYTECGALASFADIMAQETFYSSYGPASWASEFVDQFRVFIRAGDRSANQAGIPIRDVGHERPPQLGNGREATNNLNSGYRSDFVDYNEVVLRAPHDQSHHFSAFFQLGYHIQQQYGFLATPASGIAAYMVDPWNTGDRNLSFAAAAMGRSLASGSSRPDTIGSWIRRVLCE